MTVRFDHAVIAVTDLEVAIADFRRLGFDVAAGGRHASLGTANAIVRFGLDYIELLAIEHPERARASGPFGCDLVDFLSVGHGFVGYALATDECAHAARSFAHAAIDCVGPFAMDRLRPDGRRLAWQLLIPAGSPWRKPWPFLIEWATPDSERLSWDGRGVHTNGVTGVRAIEILVADPALSARCYEDGIGLQRVAQDGAAVPATRCYRVEGSNIVVTGPRNALESTLLHDHGPGPVLLTLACAQLEAAAAQFTAAGIDHRYVDDALEVAPACAQGARLRLVAATAPV